MGKVSVVIAALILFISLLSSFSTADSVSYFYDDAGKLIKTVTETGVTVLYSYDSSGNLISITNQTVNPNLPLLTGVTPNAFFTGTTTSVTITGTHLLTLQSVTSDTAGITVSGFQSTDTQITATLQVSSSAALGQANITVTTLYGSASMAVNVFQASLNPAPLYMQIGETKGLSVSVTPLPQAALNVIVNNPSPDVIGTSQSITIPSGGSGTLTVNGIKAGAVVLEVSGAKSAVFVSSPLTGPASISSRAVCAAMPSAYITLPSGSLMEANQVSVMFGPVVSGGFSSVPVSVQWVSVPDAIVTSPQVCVTISKQ